MAMAGELKLKEVKLSQLVRQVGEEAFNQKSLSVHVSVPSEPQLKIELTRGQRGGYGWTMREEFLEE